MLSVHDALRTALVRLLTLRTRIVVLWRRAVVRGLAADDDRDQARKVASTHGAAMIVVGAKRARSADEQRNVIRQVSSADTAPVGRIDEVELRGRLIAEEHAVRVDPDT